MKDKIDIKVDFTKYCGGRYRRYSKYSAEELRDDHLIPMLEEHEKIEVVIARGCFMGPSFVEEAFGGLVRALGPDVKDRIVFNENESNPHMRYTEEAKRFMSEEIGRQLLGEESE